MLDHALIGFARICAEGEDAVLVQDQPLDRAVALEGVGRGLGERETRHDVGHVAEPLAVDLFAQLFALRLVGEAKHGGRMGVIHEGVRQKRVQQRLDRRVRRGRVNEVRALHAHHVLVGERVVPTQLFQGLERHSGEPRRLDGAHVPA